jgi:hypothetical protein
VIYAVFVDIASRSVGMDTTGRNFVVKDGVVTELNGVIDKSALRPAQAE